MKLLAQQYQVLTMEGRGEIARAIVDHFFDFPRRVHFLQSDGGM